MTPIQSHITGIHSNVAISTNSVYLHYAMSGYSSPVSRVGSGGSESGSIRNVDVAREYGRLTEDKLLRGWGS